MERQVSIFDLENEQEKMIQENIFNFYLEQLESYGIDKYYRKKFKGNNELLITISEELSKLPGYEEYRSKLYNLLSDYFKNCEEVEIIYYADREYIRVNETKRSYPLFCLEMINREIFKEKKENDKETK